MLTTFLFLLLLFNSDYKWRTVAERIENIPPMKPCEKCDEPCPTDKWKHLLSSIVETVKKAQQSSNLGNIKYRLRKLEHQLDDVLNIIYINKLHNFDRVVERFNDFRASPNVSPPVCSETYDENLRDYPLFRHGWQLAECEDKQLKDVLSIGLVVSSKKQVPQILDILRNVSAVYPGESQIDVNPNEYC